MTKARTAAPAVAPSKETSPTVESLRSASLPRVEGPAEECAFRVASHEILFAPKADRRCDACGAALPLDEDANGSGYRVGGRGVYMWTRGADVRLEQAPLCASCASAIGMTALGRWEIEEEEG
jgi:hypothetical protein